MTREEKIRALKIQALKEADAAGAGSEEFQVADYPQYLGEYEPPLETQLAAGAVGLGQGMTIHTADESTAAINAALAYAKGEAGLTAPISFKDAFDINLKAVRGGNAKLRKESPGFYDTGDILGGAATVAEGALPNAALGAISGVAASEDKKPGDAVVPALIGGVLGKVTSLGRPSVQTEIADRAAERYVGAGNKKIYRKVHGAELGEDINAQGIPKLGQSFEQGADRARGVQHEAGKKIGAILSDADRLLGQPAVDYGLVATNLRHLAQTKWGGRYNQKYADILNAEADALEQRGLVSFKEAHKDYRSQTYDEPPLNKTDKGGDVSNDIKYAILDEIHNALGRIPKDMKKIGGSTSMKPERFLPDFKAANRAYETGINAAQGLENRVAAGGANLNIGLREAALLGGGQPQNVVMALLGKASKQYGDQTLAVAGTKASKIFSIFPKMAEKYPALKAAAQISNPAIGAVHLYLLNSDPAYKIEFSDNSLKAKAPRMKINGLPIPQDALGDRPFSKNPGLGMALLGSEDPSFTIENPEALMQYAQAVQKSDSLNSVQKAGILTQLGKTGKLDVSVEPEPQPEEMAPATQPQNIQTLKTMLRR